jgi:hypothetical protein
MAKTTLARGRTGTRSINAVLAAGPVLESIDFEDLPDADEHPNRLIYCPDGDGGTPCLGFSNGTAWLVVALGAALSDS